ncbi:hypothetical protein BOX15_Mlig008987g2, partial [Macrostomum lignano]
GEALGPRGAKAKFCTILLILNSLRPSTAAEGRQKKKSTQPIYLSSAPSLMAAAGRATASGRSSIDSRSFPKFQPMPSNANNRGWQRQQQSTQQQAPPTQAGGQHCGRSHSVKQQNLCPGQQDDDSDARQVCCSAHPNVAGCCSARPPALPLGAAGYSACQRPYKPPPPLGGNCGRAVPLASLTRIYRPEDEQPSAEEGAGGPDWETDGGEGQTATATATTTTGVRTDDAATAGTGAADEGADLVATHSCPVSSASPESRQGCCRRPPGQTPPLSQLQVLIQQPPQPQLEAAPANANQTDAAKPDNARRHRRRRLFFPSLSRRKKQTADGGSGGSGGGQRRRSTTEPPPTQPPPSEPQLTQPVQELQQPQVQQQQQRQRQQSISMRTAPLSSSHPWWQQQQHNQYQQRHSKQSQQPLFLQSLSSPAPLGDSTIYACGSGGGGGGASRRTPDFEPETERSPPRLHPCQRHRVQQQQQQQLTNRGPFSGLVRSRDSFSAQHYYSSRSSSASDLY